jgi:hypothetical protein
MHSSKINHLLLEDEAMGQSGRGGWMVGLQAEVGGGGTVEGLHGGGRIASDGVKEEVPRLRMMITTMQEGHGGVN